MIDDFLVRYRKEPRRRFAAELYARIAAQPERRFPGNWASLGLRTAVGAVALCLALAIFLAGSPAARATVGEIVRRIAGITFHEQTTPSLLASPETPTSPVLKHRWSLAEARARLPFNLRVPTNAPSGFRLDDDVQVWEVSQGIPEQAGPLWLVNVRWVTDHDAIITLSATYFESAPHGGPLRQEVAPGGAQQIEVNGKPVALVLTSKMWTVSPDGSTQPPEWLSDQMIFEWQQENDGAVYTLQSEPGAVSKEDLIRMISAVR